MRCEQILVNLAIIIKSKTDITTFQQVQKKPNLSIFFFYYMPQFSYSSFHYPSRLLGTNDISVFNTRTRKVAALHLLVSFNTTITAAEAQDSFDPLNERMYNFPFFCFQIKNHYIRSML